MYFCCHPHRESSFDDSQVTQQSQSVVSSSCNQYSCFRVSIVFLDRIRYFVDFIKFTWWIYIGNSFETFALTCASLFVDCNGSDGIVTWCGSTRSDCTPVLGATIYIFSRFSSWGLLRKVVVVGSLFCGWPKIIRILTWNFVVLDSG